MWKEAKWIRKKRSHDSLSLPNHYTINNKHNIVVFYKKWKKKTEIQLTKKKLFEQSKNEKIIRPPKRSLTLLIVLCAIIVLRIKCQDFF